MILFLCAGLAAAGYLILVGRSVSLLRSVLKTASVALLAAVAVPISSLLALALSLCAAGDLALSRGSERSFLAGVAAFAAGHLVYILFFLGQAGTQSRQLTEWPFSAFALAAAAIALLMAWLLWTRAGALRVPVVLYIAIILGMVLSALMVPFEGTLRFIHLGAALFFVSDFTLAMEEFVLTEKTQSQLWLLGGVVWVTYWTAQACFLLAVMP